MTLLMMSQYFETLKEIGASGKSNTVLLSHSPHTVKDITEQLREGIISGNITAKNL